MIGEEKKIYKFLHPHFFDSTRPTLISRSRKLPCQSSAIPLWFARATPYILAGQGETTHPSSLSLSSTPPTLDIPFTFCPGLPLVASGQFEHFSLRVIYYPTRTRLARRRRPSFTHVHQPLLTRLSTTGLSSCHCLSRVHTRRRARTCTHTPSHVHIYTRTYIYPSHSVFLATTRYHASFSSGTPSFLKRATINSHLEHDV